jgi:hypothetical protein
MSHNVSVVLVLLAGGSTYQPFNALGLFLVAAQIKMEKNDGKFVIRL